MTLSACLVATLALGSPASAYEAYESPFESPAAQPTELPADTRAPTYKGTALLIGGAVVAATGVVSFGFGSAGWADEPEQFESDPLNNAVAPMFDALGAMIYVPGIAMLGSGMHLRGRSEAHIDRGARDQARVAMIVGGSLIGVAAGTVAVSRIAFHTSDDALGLRGGTALGVATHMSLAGMAAGAMALGWGHGYRNATWERQQLSFAPHVGRDSVGLSLSGRF